jgi:hypothetical protein
MKCSPPLSSNACHRATAHALLAALLVVGAARAQGPAASPPVKVTIQDEKPADPEMLFAIDPVQRIQLTGKAAMAYGVRVDNQNLNLEWMYNWFQVDGKVTYPGNAPNGKVGQENQPLQKTAGDRPRVGHRSVWEINKLLVTQEVEVVTTRAKPGGNRRRDAVMIRYFVENKDTVPHALAVRAHWNDVLLMNNRGALFASPLHPNKILDGVELKGAKVPDYVQLLQKPDLKDPGLLAHLTFNLGPLFERPGRVVLTRGGSLQGDMWDAQINPAGGNSGVVIFWDPKEIKPGGHRKMAYAFGQGIAPHPDGDGHIAIALTGSFDPGKLFTIAAQVMDPAQGQSLTLELPAGMERVEGKERQPVPAVDEEGNTMVLWKARVLNTGRFHLRVHSSTGLTQTKIITITRPDEKS